MRDGTLGTLPSVQPLRVAVIGAGYWGPNLARNFTTSPHTDLLWICDIEPGKAERLARGTAATPTERFDDVLSDDRVEAIAIATPAETHVDLALAAIDSGRHVMVEKPLAASAEEGIAIVERAEARGVQVMCDHTFCYTAPVRRIRNIIRAGDLGQLRYFDSVRINLGLIQSNIDVFWDLAPHDLSILDYILPEGVVVEGVSAHGADPVGAGHACVGYLTMPLSNGGIAHVSLNWLSPTKIRTTIIGGSRRMLVWDDLQQDQRLRIFDSGVEIQTGLDDDERRRLLVSYRAGDMIAPALDGGEALADVVAEFAHSVREGRPSLTDGRAGLRVVRLLEAVDASLAKGGMLIPVEGS